MAPASGKLAAPRARNTGKPLHVAHGFSEHAPSSFRGLAPQRRGPSRGFRRATWQRALGLLAPVGRMALTNYLSRSLTYGKAQPMRRDDAASQRTTAPA
nr:DUF418 domain-containing protein [Corallococcus coralloides]